MKLTWPLHKIKVQQILLFHHQLRLACLDYVILLLELIVRFGLHYSVNKSSMPSHPFCCPLLWPYPCFLSVYLCCSSCPLNICVNLSTLMMLGEDGWRCPGVDDDIFEARVVKLLLFRLKTGQKHTLGLVSQGGYETLPNNPHRNSGMPTQTGLISLNRTVCCA